MRILNSHHIATHLEWLPAPQTTDSFLLYSSWDEGIMSFISSQLASSLSDFENGLVLFWKYIRSSLKLQRGYSWKHLAIQTDSSCLGFFNTLLSTRGILFQGFRIGDIQERVALDGMGGYRHRDRDCMCIFTRDTIPFLGHYCTSSCTYLKQFAITDFCLCQ